MIVIAKVQLHLENNEITTWRRFDLTETLLADSAHGIQVGDVISH
jgi:hypothetical protein